MQETGADFIRLYNELDHWLKQVVTDSRGSVPFWKRLRDAAKREPALARYVDDLLEYHELRNAIIHHRTYPDELLAVPTEATVSRLREIITKVTRPQGVLPVFAAAMRVFDPAATLRDVLGYLRQNGYSQVLSRVDGRLHLTTSSGITRWLAACAEAGGFTLDNARLSDVLPHDSDDACMFIAASSSVDQAHAIFQQSLQVRRPRLFALVITENGDATEDPLGIITPRDLLVEE